MFTHRCSSSVVLLSAVLLTAYVASTPAVGREKRDILVKPDVYRCKKHKEVTLTTNAEKHGDKVHQAGQLLEAECKIVDMDSTHEISIYLDDEPLELLKSDDANSRKASRVLAVSDNGKRLRCVASDNNGKPEHLEASREIEVYFPPQPQAQEDVERCDYKIGENAVINVNVYANPRPTFKWSANPDKYMKDKDYDKSNRFRIQSTEDLGKGHWLVKLSIDELRQSDFERFYYLQASNQLGSSSYVVFIKIHCDEEQRSNFLANGI
ncbi:fasciclin-3 [Nasonia vitripennis]|uniref:Immunoglobulin I-set domain-containing protein n=1 Tax=Nasonia vitripennis TaxID=7425 RepID=A0A7M7IZA9_NASVI|nr:fasciclin-3 [Nasonia vitripennis]